MIRDVGLVCGAAAIVGVSFGAIAVGAGLPVWLPTLLSVVVFAGAAQFAFVGIIAAGGGLPAAVLAGLVLNLRHLPFGFAVGDVLRGGALRRIAGSHLMLDETVAFAMAEPDPARRRALYWVSGAGLFVSWNVGVAAGALGATAVADTAALGLDATFPAVLLALIVPALREPANRRAAAVGVAVALVTTPVLPAGLPVLAALVGVLVVHRGDGGAPTGEDADGPDATPRTRPDASADGPEPGR